MTILDSRRKVKNSRIPSFAVQLFACRDKIKSVVNFEVSVEYERIREIRQLRPQCRTNRLPRIANQYNSISIDEKRFMLKIYIVASLVVDCRPFQAEFGIFVKIIILCRVNIVRSVFSSPCASEILAVKGTKGCGT